MIAGCSVIGELTTGAALGMPKRVAKLADTLVLAFNVREQVLPATPLHAPPQPDRPQAEPGLAVRLTCVPALKLALHVVGQSMPPGELVTVPLPLAVTESVLPVWLKVAITSWNAFIVTVQLPLPMHAPPQPRNNQPEFGFALRVTCATPAKFAKQAPPPPQLTPEGELVTVPEPCSSTIRVVGQRLVSPVS
jgi:hypothetical protein